MSQPRGSEIVRHDRCEVGSGSRPGEGASPGESVERRSGHRGGGDWVQEGTFETLRAAAGRIAEIEAYPVKGLFFDIHVELEFGTDEEALGHLEHKGKQAAYAVKRRVQ